MNIEEYIVKKLEAYELEISCQNDTIEELQNELEAANTMLSEIASCIAYNEASTSAAEGYYELTAWYDTYEGKLIERLKSHWSKK